jgi:hypothetical protein
VSERPKPISPYIRLQRELRMWASPILYPVRRTLFTIPADKVSNRSAYRLDDVAEQVKCAAILGYETHLTWDAERGLSIVAVTKRPNELPYELR